MCDCRIAWAETRIGRPHGDATTICPTDRGLVNRPDYELARDQTTLDVVCDVSTPPPQARRAGRTRVRGTNGLRLASTDVPRSSPSTGVHPERCAARVQRGENDSHGPRR